MDLASCKRSRATRRSIIDKLGITLEAAIDANDVTLVHRCLEQLKQKELDLTDVGNRIELLSDPNDLDNEIISNSDYSDKIIIWKISANRLLHPVTTPASSTGASLTRTNASAKLPKLQIAKYKGTIDDWERFWDQFSASVDSNVSLSKVDKFNYLKSLLSESALLTIAGLSLSEINYDIAIKLLKEKYGRVDVLISQHIQALWSTKRVSKLENGIELRRMYEEFNMHLHCLEALGKNVTSMGLVFCQVLLQALPKQLLIEWHRFNTSQSTDDLPALLDFIKRELEGLESACRVTSAQGSDLKRDKDNGATVAPRTASSSASSLVASESSSRSLPSMSQSVSRKKPFCLFCSSQNHWTSTCPDVVSNSARREALRKSKRCYNCLSSKPPHTFKTCQEVIVCRSCQKRHHTLLCPNRDRSTEEGVTPSVAFSAKPAGKPDSKLADSKTTLVASAISRPRGKTVSVLQTMCLQLRHEKGLEPVTLLFDGGSERSFIVSSLVKRLKLPVTHSEDLTVHSFGGRKEKQPSSQVSISLLGSNGVERVINVSEVLEICSGVTTWDERQIERFLQHKRNLSWSQVMGPGKVVSVDILIGADWYWHLMTGHMKRLSNYLMATESVFGYMLQGSVNAYAQNLRVISMLSVLPLTHEEKFCEELPDFQISKFWELDQAGTMQMENQSKHTLKEVKVLQDFEESTEYIDGRYQVRIPWSEDKGLLCRNFSVAKERLRRLLFKLQKDPPLLERYRAGIYEYLNNQHTEEVTPAEDDSLPTYYMPHHPIIKEDRKTTKLRIVFDASSHEENLLSLNQCQHTGPSLNPLIFDLLIRFRRHNVCVTSDVAKAFLQVSLHPDDRDATRFLWTDEPWTKTAEPKMKIFRMTRVLFGMRASPFLLAATIRLHAKKAAETHPEVSKILDRDFYVDDMLSGSSTVSRAHDLYLQSKNLMLEGGMSLTKWATNDPELRQRWIKEGVVSSEEPIELLKVLGMQWDPGKDCFSYKSAGILDAARKSKPTKRGVLEIVARLYDPLGFLTPKTLQAKLILQMLWKEKLDWDSPIPDNVALEWEDWISDLPLLNEVSIPRRCWPKVTEDCSIQLHLFCDASPQSYGAIAFLRYVEPTKKINVNLVSAKSRIAPISTISIPRLELLSCLTAVRLASNLKLAWSEAELSTYVWSDSRVALAWIEGSALDWKLFVAKRVQEIQSSQVNWNYCKSKENPADFLTHGQTLRKLINNDTWWHGPSWLRQPEDRWPSSPNRKLDEDILHQVHQEQNNSIIVQAATTADNLFPMDRFETWNKTIRVTAWMLRFKNRCRDSSINATCFLSSEELKQAELFWFKRIQAEDFPEELRSLIQERPISNSSSILRFNPVLNEDGLICLGGRLKFARILESQRHPILLKGGGPSQSLVLSLIRDRHFQTCHGGIQETLIKLRDEIWILKGRQVVRKAIKNCFICRKWAAMPPSVVEAPLPAARIQESDPFCVTGVDFAGPVWIKNLPENTKSYICLFTCAVTRAIHLELVSSQSSKSFLLAFRRFIARRGACRTVYSDNAKSFQAADRLLQEAWNNLSSSQVQDQVSKMRIQWRFIAPRAAWWGGFYERMVGSVKRHLKRMLGTALLGAEELATILTEIESVVNSRPLIAITEDSNDREYLSPSHFLLGRSGNLLADATCQVADISTKPTLLRRWHYRKRLLTLFWRKWKEEYLLQLRSFHTVQAAHSHVTLKMDDVVLIKEDKTPRGQWKMARIVELTPGRDGQIRSVMLKLSDGHQLRRSIQHICPLEVI